MFDVMSVQNARAKSWAALLDKKHRDRAGRFIVEGIHLVQEALRCGAEIEAVVYDGERGLPAELDRETALAEQHDLLVSASQAVMAKCTGTDSPPPVFAVVIKPVVNEEALFREQSLVVVLDGVRDPGNAGTIIRSADAVGADAVVLGRGCVDLYNPKTVRSTMGSLFHLPVIEADLSKLLPQAKERGIRLAATSLQSAVSCFDCDWTGPTWLVLGSESDGISADVLALADQSVIIPIRGQAESLNVAMAGTVILYEALRQRERAGK
ncbi:TrmH family RNA methyltransferase [Paenibacillus cellulosilyticus]|uniref:TrmH family RNA methyltransferase n=2 Tax=Paenibacillus cellulosilyticus TaxID=375489 RepID=A0A2V2YEN9_9BACL|nr:TrmH family RNA methyltransferase [Paenibacillus cellulosilyticus]